jgi:hypothetical protein
MVVVAGSKNTEAHLCSLSPSLSLLCFSIALFISNELLTLTTRGVQTYYFLLLIPLKLSPFSDYKQQLGDSPV